MANEFRFEDYPHARKFDPVTKPVIDAFAAHHDLQFASDYVAFLTTHNGFDFDGLSHAAPLSPGIEPFDFVRYLFGIDTGFDVNDLRIYLSNEELWEKAFCQFAYPIGEGRGGDPMVQVYKGKSKGKIYFVDHEVFTSAEDLKNEGVDLRDMSIDETLAYMVDARGCFIEIADSFSDFLSKLIVYSDNGHINVSIRAPSHAA